MNISREVVLALMLHQMLMKVTRESINKAIHRLKNELGSILIAVECKWGQGKGHLGKL